MPVLDFLNHLLSFIAPALCVALLLGVGARVLWRSATHLLPWYAMVGVNALLGVMVLALGLVLTGQDGRMGTYAALVVALGSCQWLMSGGYKR